MVRSITFLLFMLMTAIVDAQALVLRVTATECTSDGCRQIIGTGACAYIGNIKERSVYLTAAHNVLQAKTIHVGYSGQWWGARVVYKRYDNATDYAILETQKISATRCFTVAESQPANGVEAVAYGYSNGIETFKTLRAKIRVNQSGRFFSKVVARGDSGGPILVNDQLVGIIKGHDFSNTIYTDGILIRQQLIRQYGRLPDCRCEPAVIVDMEEPARPNGTDNRELVTALEVELSKLREQLDKLSKTEIPVQIIGADGKVVAEQKYPLGDPIKLRFKAVKQSEAQ